MKKSWEADRMTDSIAKTKTDQKPGLKARFGEFNKNYFIFYLLVVEIIFLTFSQSAFLSVDNIMNVLRQCSIIAIIAAGAFLVIVTAASTFRQVRRWHLSEFVRQS